MRIDETLNDGLKREYKVVIPAADIDAKLSSEIGNVAKRIRMPGFRPGKVPANLVKKMHGEALKGQVLEQTLRDSIQKVIADKKLRPAMQPQVDVKDYEGEGDLEVALSLEVLPQIDDPSFDGVSIEKPVVEVSDDDMTAALQRIADQQKSFEAAPKTKKAEAGDAVLIDFVGKVDGEPFEGGKGEGVQLVIGSGRFIPGFEDQLVGAKANDQKLVKVTFPADYNVAYLKGKDAEFDVTVTEVRVAKEAQVNEELAKNLGLDSLDQLKELLKDQIGREHEGLARTYMKRQLLDQLAERHSFPVPQTMVDAEFQQIWHQLEHEAGNDEDAKKELESERDEYRRIAERRVRLGLLLSEIGQKNGIQVTQQEFNRLVMQEAQRYPQQQAEVVKYFRENEQAAAQLRAPLYEEKVVDFIIGKLELTERSTTRDALQAAIESEEGKLDGSASAEKPAKKKAAPKKAAAEDKPKTEAKPKAEPSEKKAASKKAAPKKASTDAAPKEAEQADKPKKKPAAKKKGAGQAEG